MNKKIILGILLVVLVGLGVWLYLSRNQVKAYEFAGRLEKIEGNTIFTTGLFMNIVNPPAGQQEETEMKIVVDNKTQFKKVVQYLPTEAELEKTGGMYKVEDLKKEEKTGSIDDLKAGLTDGVFAMAQNNIYGKQMFTASVITYYTRENPQ